MKFGRLTLASALLASALLAGCGFGSGTSEKELAAAAKESGTVNGLCPIQERPVVPGLVAEYQGQKIGFCCGPCRPKFLANPEKYMALMKADPKKYGYKP